MKLFKICFGLLLISGILYFNFSGIVASKNLKSSLNSFNLALAQEPEEVKMYKPTMENVSESCTKTVSCNYCATGKINFSAHKGKITDCPVVTENGLSECTVGTICGCKANYVGSCYTCPTYGCGKSICAPDTW